MIADVLIIGAGVIGCMIARELSLTNVSVVLIEALSDVSLGASKANSGIVHAGYDAKQNTQKAKFNVAGAQLLPMIAKELDVPYKNTGSLVTAFNDRQIDILEDLIKNGRSNGVRGLHLFDGNRARQIEPNLSLDVRAVLKADHAGIVCPYQLTIAAAENAVQNGAVLHLNHPVHAIKKEGDLFFVSAGQNRFVAKNVINAAGVFADTIAAMVEPSSFTIIPRRGEYMVLDKTQKDTVRHVIFQTPSDEGKGILVAPTPDGNVLVGPTADQIEDKLDTNTTAAGQMHLMEGASKAVPCLNFHTSIRSFSGIRATPDTHDFIIEPSKHCRGLFHVAGIESPGLTAAPAIAVHVKEMLEHARTVAKHKFAIRKNAAHTRTGITDMQSMSFSEKQTFVKDHPSYANMICRCEFVSEGEIVESIHRPVGATTVDGVKRRVRAGMGRCQSGFCLPKVLEILARERNISIYDIEKENLGSKILIGPTGSEV